MKTKKIALAVLLVGTAARAEDRPSSHFYRVDLAVHEVAEGKKASTRSYSMMVRDRESSSVQIGFNLPFVSGNGSVVRQDVGTKIVSLVEEQDGLLVAHTSFEAGEVAPPDGTSGEAGRLGPSTRKLALSTVCALAPGKPATVGSADDPATHHRVQLELTVTQVK
jgi:hypothetical protein